MFGVKKVKHLYAGLVPIPENCPWFYPDEEQSQHFTAELRKELGAEHFLYQWRSKLVVIAKCAANDDVVVVHEDDFGKMFWAHLTFSGKVDPVPCKFPSAAPVPNADLVTFFRSYMRDEALFDPFAIKHEHKSVLDVLTEALVDLEQNEDIVICSPTPHAVALRLLEDVRPYTRAHDLSFDELKQLGRFAEWHLKHDNGFHDESVSREQLEAILAKLPQN